MIFTITLFVVKLSLKMIRTINNYIVTNEMNQYS